MSSQVLASRQQSGALSIDSRWNYGSESAFNCSSVSVDRTSDRDECGVDEGVARWGDDIAGCQEGDGAGCSGGAGEMESQF